MAMFMIMMKLAQPFSTTATRIHNLHWGELLLSNPNDPLLLAQLISEDPTPVNGSQTIRQELSTS